MNILHISDTHYLIDQSKQFVLEMEVKNNLESFFKSIDYSLYDLIIHTGDIIFDGETADYQAYFDLVNQYIPEDLPVLYAFGNHDNKEAFYQVKGLNEFSGGFYYYSKDIGDYRFIVLDSSDQSRHDGYLDDQQVEFLANSVAETDKDIVIALHHPFNIGWGQDGVELVMTEEVRHILDNPQIIAVLCGHLHMHRVYRLDNLLQFSTYPLSFGISTDNETRYLSNRLGYGMLRLEGKEVDYNTEIFLPEQTYFRVSLD